MRSRCQTGRRCGPGFWSALVPPCRRQRSRILLASSKGCQTPAAGLRLEPSWTPGSGLSDVLLTPSTIPDPGHRFNTKPDACSNLNALPGHGVSADGTLFLSGARGRVPISDLRGQASGARKGQATWRLRRLLRPDLRGMRVQPAHAVVICGDEPHSFRSDSAARFWTRGRPSPARGDPGARGARPHIHGSA